MQETYFFTSLWLFLTVVIVLSRLTIRRVLSLCKIFLVFKWCLFLTVVNVHFQLTIRRVLSLSNKSIKIFLVFKWYCHDIIHKSLQNFQAFFWCIVNITYQFHYIKTIIIIVVVVVIYLDVYYPYLYFVIPLIFCHNFRQKAVVYFYFQYVSPRKPWFLKCLGQIMHIYLIKSATLHAFQQ